MRCGEVALSRFVIAGAANTGITYVLYLALLQFIPYIAAYSLTYFAGIALGYVLNAYVVFKERPTVKSAAMYPLVYALYYLLGLGLLYGLVELFGVPSEIAPLLVIGVSVPVMYSFTRFIFKGLENEKTIN
jgi:putative flippase GtrA